MPKQTFYNLDTKKKDRFIQAFLKEFSSKLYEEASITSVVKQLGIAKGSVYQYFDDKLDLFLHLKTHCEGKKMEHIEHSKREDYDDFWEYFKSLYQQGVKFDINCRLESRFLYMLGKNTASPEIGQMLKDWKNMAIAYFSTIIQKEIDNGNFRDDLPLETMSFFLVSSSMMVGDLMESKFDLDPNQNIAADRPVFADQEKELLKAVDGLIALLRNALDKHPS